MSKAAAQGMRQVRVDRYDEIHGQYNLYLITAFRARPVCLRAVLPFAPLCSPCGYVGMCELDLSVPYSPELNPLLPQICPGPSAAVSA